MGKKKTADPEEVSIGDVKQELNSFLDSVCEIGEMVLDINDKKLAKLIDEDKRRYIYEKIKDWNDKIGLGKGLIKSGLFKFIVKKFFDSIEDKEVPEDE